LEERLQARLQAHIQSEPRQAATRLLRWPVNAGQTSGFAVNLAASVAGNEWLRVAAALLIAAVVAGGGWAIASMAHPPAREARATPQTARPSVANEGFSSAGAMRTPQTLAGPAAPEAAPALTAVPAATAAPTAARRIMMVKKTAAMDSAKTAATASKTPAAVPPQ
jgi:hypothetical protein